MRGRGDRRGLGLSLIQIDALPGCGGEDKGQGRTQPKLFGLRACQVFFGELFWTPKKEGSKELKLLDVVHGLSQCVRMS